VRISKHPTEETLSDQSGGGTKGKTGWKRSRTFWGRENAAHLRYEEEKGVLEKEPEEGL